MTNLLSPTHRSMLEEESAVLVEQIERRGYRTVSEKTVLRDLGFSSSQQNVPGLLIPVCGANGEPTSHQFRPDEPRVIKGKKVKYETPAGSRMVMDCLVGANQLRDPNVPLWITEGIKKTDSAISQGLCCVGLLGVTSWRGKNENGGKTALPEWDDIALNGRTVYIAFDSDVMVKPPVRKALTSLGNYLESKGAQVLLVTIPSDGEKVGLDDYFRTGGKVEDLESVATRHLSIDAEATVEKLSALERIVTEVKRAGLLCFKDETGHPYCSFPKENSLVTCRPIEAKGFIFATMKRAGISMPSNRTLDEVVERLTILAQHEELCFPTARRIWTSDSQAWLYLNDSARTIFRVDADGFCLADTESVPVRFAPSKNMRSLPLPAEPTIKPRLTEFLNINPEDECIAWAFLVGCFLPCGTMPVLIAQGEQGSGKTLGASLLRELIDPNAVNLAPLKPDAGALRSRMRSGHIVGYDNVSKLSGEFSDLLCSLVSGTGFADRALYSDAEEHIVTGRAPVILNGITDFAERSDLADRTLILRFLRLDRTTRRKGESEIQKIFSQKHAEFLGELLLRVSRAFREYENTTIPADSGRLLDLIRFVEASEPPDEKGDFRRAYRAARQEQHDSAADTDPLLRAIITIVRESGTVCLTNAELLSQATTLEFGDKRPPFTWPQSTRALSNMLSRDIPKLRSLGIEIERMRDKDNRGWRLAPLSSEGDDLDDSRTLSFSSQISSQVPESALNDTMTTMTLPGANSSTTPTFKQVTL